MDITLSQLREQIHDLEQKIVKSPERIQADTAEKEVELEAKRNEKKKLEKQYMELIRAVDYLKESSKSLMPSLESFTEAFKDIESMKTQCEVLCKTKLSVTKKEEQLKTFKVQLREQEKTIQTLKAQIVNNEKQFQQQIQTMRQLNNGMNKELKTKTESKSSEERNLFEETQRLKDRFNELDEQHKAFRDRFQMLSKQESDRVMAVHNMIKTRMSQVQQLKQKNVNK